MTLKDELTSLCTGIILSQVRVKGRETYINDESGINRNSIVGKRRYRQGTPKGCSGKRYLCNGILT